MKTFLKLASISILCLAQISAKEKTLPDVTNVVSARELTPEGIQGLIDGMFPDIAIEFQEGSEVPLQFLLNYKIFSLKCNPNLTVKIDSTYYLRSVRGKFYLSLDMITWEKASKFFKGELVPKIQHSSDKSFVLVEANLVDSWEE